jgi:hypothetical protein
MLGEKAAMAIAEVVAMRTDEAARGAEGQRPGCLH